MRRSQSLRARLLDDTLVTGLVILFVAAVVLFVTSRALTGLPWQKNYRVTVEVSDAAKLVKHADVRIGGARVGQVLKINAVKREGDKPPHAELELQLRESAWPLPKDTTAEVRLASVLGGKYLSLVPGRSTQMVADDGRLPLRNAIVSVDLDDAFKVFDEAGREGFRTVIREMGDAVAGRGGDFNQTLANTVELLPPVQRVLRTLDAAETDLPGFLRGAAAATSGLVPVKGELTPFISKAAITLNALDTDALEDTVRALPETQRDTTRALRTLRPVLDDAAEIATEMRPAAVALRPAAARLNTTARTATRVAPKTAALAPPLGEVLDAVRGFTSNPSSYGALQVLGSTDLATFGASAFVGLGGILSTVWEAEEHCRVASNWVAGLNEILSDGDPGGNCIRMIPIFHLEEMLPTDKPAEGLHFNPYPNMNAQECEAGNEPYLPGTRIGNVPGLQGVAK
jgi:virulence factor Mce-like protein